MFDGRSFILVTWTEAVACTHSYNNAIRRAPR